MKGIQLKKGQLVEIDFENVKGIFRVEKNNEFWKEFNSWGSVKLENLDGYFFTHKGGIKLLTSY